MNSTRTLSAAAAFVITAATSLAAQGLPVAELRCNADAGGIKTDGFVQVSLFTYGSAGAIGGAAERQQIKAMLLNGRAHEIPGTLNVIGVFNYAGARLDLDVMLTGGTFGTGQYWFNGMSHRAKIVELRLVQGGFVTRDENGAVAQFNCQ